MSAKQRGSIIAFTLIVLSFILTSGLAVITVASLERKSGLINQKSVVAFQAADSGAERLLKRIYIDNSPSRATIPEDGTMPDATLIEVAQNLVGVQPGVSCDAATDTITATSNSSPAYTFQATLLDGSGVAIDCADTTWRDKVVRMKVDGFYRQTARVIEMGIKPRPKCNPTVDDADGNTYDVIEIADMCWTKQNMRMGNRINSGTPQTNNGTIEYYCYGNSPPNCSSDNPNYPDGGFYAWDEAMQYVTNERAQGICPTGWHIPSDGEWYVLENSIDSTINNPTATGWRGIDGGTKLKPGGSSDFNFNLNGLRSFGESGRGDEGHLWSSTLTSPTAASTRAVVNVATPWIAQIWRGDYPSTGSYMGVRCVLD